MPSHVVRAAFVDDAPALIELYRQMVPEAEMPSTEAAAGVIQELSDREGHHLLVAEVDGKVVGTVTLVVVPNITHAARPWAQVENMVVLDEYRRRGIGRALIERCAELTRKAGGYDMQLISSAHRKEAHAFYESCGFRPDPRGFRMFIER